MLDLLNAMFQSLSPLWEMSVTAAYAATVVIFLRLLLKKRAPRQILCLLWLVVFARLLIPVSLESPLSIVPNALPGQEYAVEQAPAGSGAGDPAAPIAPQDPVQDQPQNQPGNDTATPAAGGQNSSLSVPEGVGPTAPTSETSAVSLWQAVIAGVWLTGAAAIGGYALASWLRLRRRLFDAIRAGDGVWEHPAVDSPFILGVLRPRIYLPAGLTGQPRQFILCHERAHLRRFDHIVKPVCWIALALHWFNPLAWAAFLLMSRDIEAACDEAVLRQLGSGIKADYSDTLLVLATRRRLPAPCPLAFDEGDARGRIRNVLNYRRPAFWAVVISVMAAALAAVCLLTDPVTAKGSEGDPDPDPDASNSQDAERLDRNLDLNGNGVPETVQIMELDGGRRLELWESDKLIFTEKGYYAHAGYNSMFLCTLDGKDYLLRYHPNGAQGWCHYSYELFTLTRDGQEKVIQENSVEFDINFGPMHESFDPEALAAFMDEINSLLANSVQLINTNDELLGTFQKEGRLYDSLSWLDLWAPVYVRNETASLLENLRTFQASMEIAKDYPSVLLGKSKFVLYQDEQTSSLARIDDVPALISKDDPYVKISNFTVVDMDGDGTDEVLVWVCGITTDFSGYLLLRQENWTIYGTIFDAHNNWSNRWFDDLKTDGTFECHDVLDRWHSISKLFFTVGGGTGIYGLTVIRNDPDYDLESFMTVQKEVTREEDWWAAVDAQKEKPDAVWYEFNKENIIAAFMKG